MLLCAICVCTKGTTYLATQKANWDFKKQNWPFLGTKKTQLILSDEQGYSLIFRGFSICASLVTPLYWFTTSTFPSAVSSSLILLEVGKDSNEDNWSCSSFLVVIYLLYLFIFCVFCAKWKKSPQNSDTPRDNLFQSFELQEVDFFASLYCAVSMLCLYSLRTCTVGWGKLDWIKRSWDK